MESISRTTHQEFVEMQGRAAVGGAKGMSCLLHSRHHPYIPRIIVWIDATLATLCCALRELQVVPANAIKIILITDKYKITTARIAGSKLFAGFQILHIKS